jgi:hypothetical protein
MTRTLLTFFTLLLLPTLQARAQQTQTDSVSQKIQTDTLKARRDSTLVFYFFNNFDQFGKLNVKVIDTATENSHKYDPASRNYKLRATLGNTGSASTSLIPYPFTRNAGFDYGIHAFDPWLFQNDSVKYYKVLKTFTDIKYVQGAKKEIFLNATFSRNIIKSFNLGFDFRVLSSTGSRTRRMVELRPTASSPKISSPTASSFRSTSKTPRTGSKSQGFTSKITLPSPSAAGPARIPQNLPEKNTTWAGSFTPSSITGRSTTTLTDSRWVAFMRMYSMTAPRHRIPSPCRSLSTNWPGPIRR